MRAPLRELSTLAEIYDEDRRPKATIPLTAFDIGSADVAGAQLVPAAGSTIELVDGTVTAQGTVKRVLIEVEVDMSTVKNGPDPNQETLL